MNLGFAFAPEFLASNGTFLLSWENVIPVCVSILMSVFQIVMWLGFFRMCMFYGTVFFINIGNFLRIVTTCRWIRENFSFTIGIIVIVREDLDIGGVRIDCLEKLFIIFTWPRNALLPKIAENKSNSNLTVKNSPRNQDRAYFLLYTTLGITTVRTKKKIRVGCDQKFQLAIR
jgi:hypothetical protein